MEFRTFLAAAAPYLSREIEEVRPLGASVFPPVKWG